MVEVEQRRLRALEEHALPVAQRRVDVERRVGDVRTQPLRVALVLARDRLELERLGFVDRSSQRFFSASATSIFWRRIFGSRMSWTRIPSRIALSA